MSILELYLREVIGSVANVEPSTRTAAQPKPKWDAGSFARALLSSRYAHLHADSAVEGLDDAIAAARVAFLETTFRLPPPSPQMAAMIRERARHFVAWRQTRIAVDAGAWHIVLADFVEDVGSTVVGPLSVRASSGPHSRCVPRL